MMGDSPGMEVYRWVATRIGCALVAAHGEIEIGLDGKTGVVSQVVVWWSKARSWVNPH